MKKKITFLIAILTLSFGYAQTLPFDFSDSGQLMTGADGAVVSIVQDNGNDVLQVVGNGGQWDNAQINFSENIDLSDDDNNTITFRIKAVNGTGSGNHALKFEQGTTGDTEVQFSITGTEWTDVSLDFGAGLGSYGRMVLFTDFGDVGGGLSDTYLFDDIDGAFHSTPVLPNLPFDFSSDDQLMTGADGAVVTIVQDNGNDVLQVVGNGGQWDNAQINFQDNLDLSDDDNNTITFRIKAVNGTGSGNHALKFEQGTTGDTEVQFSITGTEWTDVSLDFGAGLGNYGRMVLFTDFGDVGGGLSDTYLFDDISGATHLSSLGLGELEVSELILSPNPTTGIFNLNLKSNELVMLKIYDTLGKLVFYEKNRDLTQNSQINLALPKGLYFLKVNIGNKVIAKKLIIK